MSLETEIANQPTQWELRVQRRERQREENRLAFLGLVDQVVGYLGAWELDGDQPSGLMRGIRHLKTGAQVWVSVEGDFPDDRPLANIDRLMFHVRWPVKPSTLRGPGEAVTLPNHELAGRRPGISVGFGREPKQIAASFENRLEVEAIELWQKAFKRAQDENSFEATRDATYLDLVKLTGRNPQDHEVRQGMIHVRSGFAGSPDIAVHGGNCVYINFRGLDYDDAVRILRTARKESDE